MHIAQNGMTLEQQVLKLAPIEGAQLVLDFLYPLRIAPIARFGNFTDLYEVSRYSRDKLENRGKARVVGNEEFATDGARIAFALVVVVQIDIDAFGLALDNGNRCCRVGLRLLRSHRHVSFLGYHQYVAATIMMD